MIAYIKSLLKKQNETLALREYEKAIKHLADTKSSFNFRNKSGKHAHAVVANLFRTAENYVSIFSGSLSGPLCHPCSLIELEKFLTDFNHQKKLEVILSNHQAFYQKTETLQLIKKFQPYFPENIRIEVAQPHSIHELKEKEALNDFVIADDRIYRKEVIHDKYVDFGSYNHPAETLKLKGLFHSIQSRRFL